MKRNGRIKSYLPFALVFLLAPMCTEAQCEIFKSEIEGAKNHITMVSHLTDSLQTFAESAAFAAQYNMARSQCA